MDKLRLRLGVQIESITAVAAIDKAIRADSHGSLLNRLREALPKGTNDEGTTFSKENV